METTALIVWIYGALVLIGGVMGWLKAHSKPSLISGVVFGVALIVVGYGIYTGHTAAVTAATAIAGLLAITMGIRFAKTKAFMPAGLMLGMSLLVAVTLLLRR